MYTDPLGRKQDAPLDPTRHTIDDLLIRQAGQPRLFSAVWMQNPRTTGGNIIKTDWFHYCKPSEVPTSNIIWARGWDLAFSEKEVAKSNPDYTAGARIGLWRENGEYAYYLWNITRWRELWPITRKKTLEIAKHDGSNTLFIVEGGGPQKGLGDSLKADKEFKPFRVRIVTPVSDKVARAQYWVDEAEVGKFILVEGEWNSEFIAESEIFNNGKHDDQIDSVSIAFWYLKDLVKRKSAIRTKVRGLYTK